MVTIRGAEALDPWPSEGLDEPVPTNMTQVLLSRDGSLTLHRCYHHHHPKFRRSHIS